MPSVNFGRHDRGSATVEAVLLAPALVMLMLFVTHLGRWSSADARLRTAADHAARAASLVHPARMNTAARAAALDNLTTAGLTCERFSISAAIVHPSDPRVVEVSLQCDIARAGLDVLGVTARQVSASSSEVVDRWRTDS